MNDRSISTNPMGTGSILNHTFSTYFKKFGTFAIFTLIVNGILALAIFALEQSFSTFTTYDPEALALFLDKGMSGVTDYRSYITELSEILPGIHTPPWVGIISFVATLFISPIVLGGISYVTTGHFLGENHTPREYLSLTLSKYKSLFITNFCIMVSIFGIIIMLSIAFLFLLVVFGFITAIASFVGILLIFGQIFFAIIVALFISGAAELVYPVAIRENMTGFAPIVRAFKLGLKKFWKTVGIVLILMIIMLIASTLSTLAVEQAAALAFSNSRIILGVVGVIISLLIKPLLSIAMNINYLSIRSQAEVHIPNQPQVPLQEQIYQNPEIPQEPIHTDQVDNDIETQEDPSDSEPVSEDDENTDI